MATTSTTDQDRLRPRVVTRTAHVSLVVNCMLLQIGEGCAASYSTPDSMSKPCTNSTAKPSETLSQLRSVAGSTILSREPPYTLETGYMAGSGAVIVAVRTTFFALRLQACLTRAL